jgi:hypothetical protein
MIMKKTSVFFLGLAAILLTSGMSAFGQEKQTTLEREVTTGFSFQEPRQLQPAGENMFVFVNSEFSFDKLVKGAPYSAQAVTEMTQILSDGNRIVNTSSAAVYRDGEGRTRREQTLRAIGNLSASGEPLQTISINDPVAGVAYVLEPHSHTARKIEGLHIQATSGAGYKLISSGGEGDNFTFNTTPGGVVQLKRATAEARASENKEKKGFLKEDLGMQTVEGVNATGTRTTITIAAGQIGNERAIEIVDERWFSPDLQTMVMTRHSDPRSGETVYRLTNITRAEPDHSLFEVPADYIVNEQEPMRVRRLAPTKPEQQ